MAAHRVDFVDEDNAGRVLLALLEQIADTRGSDADEHLDKVGTTNGEKRYVGFAGDRTREERLTGPRRTHEQHAFRNPSAELLKLLRFLQEIDDFLELLF